MWLKLLLFLNKKELQGTLCMKTHIYINSKEFLDHGISKEHVGMCLLCLLKNCIQTPSPGGALFSTLLLTLPFFFFFFFVLFFFALLFFIFFFSIFFFSFFLFSILLFSFLFASSSIFYTWMTALGCHAWHTAICNKLVLLTYGTVELRH